MYSSSQRIKRLIVGLLLAASICRASITLNPIDRGLYDESGGHDSTLTPYTVGRPSASSLTVNNFFVFDISSVIDEVISAEIWIESNWYISTDPSETFTVYDIIGSIPAIRDGSAGVSGFTDMQSGNTYGNISVSSADNGTVLHLILNAQAIQDINAGLGGLFAIGGTVSTLDMATPREEEIFVFTDTANPADGVELRLTIVPEPSALGLLILTSGMMVLRRIRIR